MNDLTRSDLWLAASTRRHGDDVWIEEPGNPGYQWGNALWLSTPPTADDLADQLRRAHEGLPVAHAMLRWDGTDLDEPTRAQARALGLRSDRGLAMVATAMAPRPGPAQVQPVSIGPAVDALNVACDATEQQGDPEYVAFKRGLRQAWRRWEARGDCRWWQAFVDGRPVAQCGMVLTPEGSGRFQSVEVLPGFRRRGIARQLVSTVGADALGKVERLLLAVDPEGPAMALYEDLGFRRDGWQHALLDGGADHVLRPETMGDRPTSDTVVGAAFDSTDEVAILRRLRAEDDAFVWVAVRDGTLDGVVAVSATAQEGVCGLGPVAVRPLQQGRGVGSQLVRAAMEEARRRGFHAMVVLGDPAYYGRFGFRAAPGLRCRWEVPPEALQVAKLDPDGALPTGLVGYSAAFGPG